MKQLSLMTDRELKQLCRKLLDEKSQLVEALKKAYQILKNVKAQEPRVFQEGLYDEPGDEKSEQIEADLLLLEIDFILLEE